MLEFYKMVGTLAGCSGAFLLALNIPESPWGFVLFMLSSVSWVLAGLDMEDNYLVILNVVFSSMNALGIARWLM